MRSARVTSRARTARCPTGSCFPCSTRTRSRTSAPDARPTRSPETREREAVGKVSSIFSDAGQYGWGFNAPAAGRYRIRLKGYSVWVSGGGIGRWFYEGQGAEKAPVYWLPVWHRPNADEIWPGRNNEPIGIYAQSAGQTRPVGVMDFTPKPTVGEIEVQLAAARASAPTRCGSSARASTAPTSST